MLGQFYKYHSALPVQALDLTGRVAMLPPPYAISNPLRSALDSGAFLRFSRCVSWFFSPWLAAVWLFLILYTFAFFRDPDRVAPDESDAVVAAADGVVADIVEVEERDVLKRPMKRVGIFLSVFDVHTNRAPDRWPHYLPRTS